MLSMRRGRSLSAVLVPLFAALASSAAATTYTVTDAGDSGIGTLRQAILDANAAVGADTIEFNIVGSGVHTIALATELPDITDPVTIDGYTQPGSAANTNDTSAGLNTVLLIEVDGAALSSTSVCLDIAAADTTIRGLVINGCGGAGIRVANAASNAVIEGNFIGTDPTGTTADSVRPTDQIIGTAPANLKVGGTTPAARNLISGGGDKLDLGQVPGPAGLIVQGNLIGTNAAGTSGLPDTGMGINFERGTNALIGGTDSNARNVISGNSGTGISIGGPTVSNSTIAGNFIGVDVTGTQPLGNGNYGVSIGSPNVTIGGSAPGAGNVISANADIGLILGQSAASFFSVVYGNFIGTDVTGTIPLGNTDRGIHAGGADNIIGGPGPGEGNVIAYTRPAASQAGVGVYVPASPRNRIRGNSIFGNAGIGIDNMPAGIPDGVTPNDPGDADGGGNSLQNFPVLSSVTTGATTRIQGALHSTASTVFDLDFYSNPACSNYPREFQEGTVYLGTAQVTTDGSGDTVFDVTLPVATETGARIAATATNPSGSTSEFSQRLPFSVAPASGPPAGGTNITVKGTDFAAGASVTLGGQPLAGINIVDHKTITATTPAFAAGTASDLVVTNTDGTNGTLVKGFVSDFTDVTGGTFYPFVTTLVSNGITAGIGGGLYGVNQSTVRQQMAVFLLKAKYGLCYTPPPCVGTFGDVPCPSTFANWIEALAALGITGGCGGGNYCPLNPVRRDQMAVFLLKTKYGSSYVPPACNGDFGDVPCPSPFADWIEQLAAEAITGGCGGGNYCPLNPNTRGQMAVFIVKTFGLQ